MDVAIIGAGFSGMLTAYLLEQKGYNVTIFEKEEYTGGHCRTLFSKNIHWELGTICSFSNQIKELLIDLEIDYTERFIYKHFIDADFNLTEHMSQDEVKLLLTEIEILKDIFEKYSDSFKDLAFSYIHEDLLLPFSSFIKKHKLFSFAKFISPFLSAFGFGHIDSVQSYYILKIFNIQVINSYLESGKLLFFKNGTSELIRKLSANISDIRYSLEVNNIEVFDKKVRVDTPYSSDVFDKVLVTTKLPCDVIKDSLYNNLMKKIETNPIIACAYEVRDCEAVTSYFKENQGLTKKIQFFRITNQNNRKILVAYCYGHINKQTIDGITNDIKASGIDIKHLITAKQWYIFPHIKAGNLNSNFYRDIQEHQKNSNICLIGSLVSIPSLDNLYASVKKSVEEIIKIDVS